MPAVHKRTDMTYLTRIQQLNSANLAEYRPLILDGYAVGLIWEHNLARLQAHGIALREEARATSGTPPPTSPPATVCSPISPPRSIAAATSAAGATKSCRYLPVCIIPPAP